MICLCLRLVFTVINFRVAWWLLAVQNQTVLLSGQASLRWNSEGFQYGVYRKLLSYKARNIELFVDSSKTDFHLASTFTIKTAKWVEPTHKC